MLAKTTSAPVDWLLNGMLGPGLYLLAGRPKLGKSWLALQLIRALPRGERVLGRKSKASACIYYALEDNKQRIQSRIHRFQDPDSWGDTRVRVTLGETELLDQLETDYEAESFRLAVVDTL